MQVLGTSSGKAADVKAARPAHDGGVRPSSATFDDTLPFPPPVHGAARSAGPERRAPAGEPRGLSLEQLAEASLARTSTDRSAAMAPVTSETPLQAGMVTDSPGNAPPGRLHWRGRELSPEFLEYARRVARGENLPPFRGRLLADESLALPWEAEARPRRRKALRALGLLLLGAGLVAVVAGPLPSRDGAPAWSQVAVGPSVVARPRPAVLSSAPPEAAPPAALSPAASSPPALSPDAPSPQAVPAAAPPMSAIRSEAVSSTAPDPGASQLSHPPPVAAAPQAPSAPASAVRQPPPRKASPSPPAVDPAAPGTSLLLVEKPPF